MAGSKSHHRPLAREIVYLEPSAMAQRLLDQRHLTLLESAMRQEHLGRYSFLACNPIHTLEARGNSVLLDGVAQDKPALAVADHLLARGRLETLAGLPPFQGGLAGFISYDHGQGLEPGARIPAMDSLLPGLMLHAYDTVIAIDHLQERAWIISREGEGAADDLEKLLKRKPMALGPGSLTGFRSNFTRPAYEEAVRRVVEYILAGDIFQANISQCFEAKYGADFDAFAFYRTLRKRNPAPFAAYLGYGDIRIASSSPERLLSLTNGRVEARPIKGTRRRDPDPARDAGLVAELMASRKDRAENVMIVDLLRNDLSRVCKPGTVRVPVLCGLESYAGVHHLTSVVTGDLKAGRSIADLVTAAFPGGSITGAPKIRAMEIIAETEGQARGVYCGSIGWFGYDGNADLNIAIRTVQFAGGLARFQGGGGITARSDAAAEYEETLTKVSRIVEAFAP